MRGFQDIKVLRGVTHILAPRDPTVLLRLSEAELPLDGGVSEILASLVSGGLHDAQAKAAAFVVRGHTHPSGIFARLLGPSPRLVALSKGLARNLYAIAQHDVRVSDGTLAVVLCSAVSASGAPARFPALLKLDPAAALRTVMDKDPHTKRARVRLELDPHALQSNSASIQKCAFVRVVDPSAEFEMLVVDRQRRPEVVSHFWVGDFLGAKVVLDAPERTKRLYRSLLAGRNNVEPDLEVADLAKLDQIIAGTVVQASVNLDNLIENLPFSRSIRERIDTVVSRSLPDRVFDLDPVVSAQFNRRRTYQGDNGLRLSVEAAFSGMVHVEDIEKGTQKARRRKIWFETQTWKET